MVSVSPTTPVTLAARPRGSAAAVELAKYFVPWAE
jgi:hypothetical protein